MQKGFIYLTVIIDVYSRYIVGWGLSNSLVADSSPSVIKKEVSDYGKPRIINSDQGTQFTCKEYVDYLKKQSIQMSMDGKGRALDNIYIERFCENDQVSTHLPKPRSIRYRIVCGDKKVDR